MSIRQDDRGVSQVIGAVILFGAVIIAFTTYQVTIVPDQNEEIEFNAYQDARSDVIDLHNNIIASGTRGVGTGTTLTLGTTYPSRTFAVNPVTPTGILRTGPPRNVSFQNITAIGAEERNTRGFWNGARTYVNATSGISFQPRYNEFDAQPIVATGETVYTVGEDRLAPVTGQSLVTGNRIRLLFIDGELDAQGLEASVTAQPQSTVGRSVTVTGDGGPLTLRLDPPPQVSADAWIDRYGSRMTSSNTRIQAVTNASGQIQVKLDGSRTYTLQLARVTVGSQEPDAEDEDPAYVIAAQGNDEVVTVGQRARVVAEVRDQFNNPVAESNVTFSIIGGDGQFLDDDGELLSAGVNRTVATDAQGQAPVRAVPTAAEDDLVVRAEVENETGEFPRTNFTIQVSEQTQSIGSGAFYTSFSRSSAEGPEDSLQGATFQFKNVDEEEQITITDVTVERVSTTDNRISSSNENEPWDWILSIYSLNDDGTRNTRLGGHDTQRVDIGETMDLGTGRAGSQVTLDPQQRVKFHMYEFQPANQNLNGEFMELTIEFTRLGESFSVTRTLILF